MPIYEYECKKCKAHVEILQKITDQPLTKCRKCGGKLEKQWSAAGFQFKGTGWYVTDYAGKKRDAAEEKKSSGSAASESKPTTATADASTATATTDKPASSEKSSSKKSNSAASKTSGD